MGKRINWNTANRRESARKFRPIEFKVVPATEDFWRAWRENPQAMRDAGYQVRKTPGGWQVTIEVEK